VLNRLQFIIFIFLFSVNVYSIEKIRIAIIDFEARGTINKEFGNSISSQLTTKLINSKKFIVVERSNIQEAMNELKLQNQDEFDDSTASELGNLLGASSIVFGSISKIDALLLLNIKIIDVKSGELKYTFSEKFDSIPLLVNGVTIIADKISNDISSTEKLSFGKLNYKEKKFFDKYITQRWQLEVYTDKDVLVKKHNIFMGAGIGLLVGGLILNTGGLLVPAILGIYGSATGDGDAIYGLFGLQALIPGLILSFVSLAPFYFMNMIRVIFKKMTGSNLVISNINIEVGYNTISSEALFGLSLKL